MKKTLLFSLVALFVSLFAKAQGSDDFATMSLNNTYAEYTSTAGWVGTNCQVIANADLMGEAQAVVINGKTSAVGSITSPTLTGGCGALTINYAYTYSESNGVSFHVAVMQNGAAVKEYDVVDATLAKSVAAVNTTDINVEGDFSIVITNNSPSGSTKNKDRYAIWGITWTAYGETGGEEPGTDPTPEPEPDPDPVVDVVEPVISPDSYHHANTVDVTITAEEGLTVYYTIDGTDPTTESSVYSEPITISATDATVTATVKAIAVDAEGNVSDIVSATYSVYVVKPMEVPAGCVGFDFVMNPWGYTLGENLTSPVVQDGVTFSFEGGSTPTRMWSYNGGGQLRVYKGAVLTFTAPAGKIITSMVFDIAQGTYEAGNGTWDATTGTWTGSEESAVVNVAADSKTGQIRTILVALADKPSVVVEAPVITPATGTYSEAQTVTITAAEGNSIFYTLDGTDPSDASTLYEGPFTVSETTTIKAIATNDDDVASAVATSEITIMPTYKSIAEMLAVITTTKVEVAYEFENLLVQGVNGANVYVHDGANAFLIYCYDSNLKKGDKISGKVTGQIYLYNNLPEISLTGDKWAGVTVASEGNEVVPAVKTIPELTKDIVNEFIRLEGVSFSLASGSNYTFTDGSNSINIYEKNLLKDVTFSTEEKYNINAFVSIYKETIQLSITSADDVELITELKDAEAAWDVEEVEINVGETLNNKFTTVSDGAVTYTSSHPAVVAVAEDGTLTVAGLGRAVITAEVAETATYLADKAEFVVVVRSDADGSLEKPYLVSDAMAIYVSDATIAGMWVKGYMIGYVEGSSPSGITLAMPTEAQTEVIIANTADETDVNNCFVVQLPKGQIRDDVELFAHPELYGKEIMFKGDILKYFGIAGMKNTTDYSLDGGVTIPTGINCVEVEDANASKEIYTIAGQRVNTITKGGIYIINGKKVLVK